MRHCKKIVLAVAGTALAGILTVYVAFHVSPWPSALLIRHTFNKGSKKTSQALEKHVPPSVESSLNEQYRPSDNDAYLDVYYPSSIKDTAKTLPAIVWVHGGAFISGDKTDIANYAKILAAHNFTVISVGYSIAPEKHYPTPIFQVNDALAYLDRNAVRLHIDSSQYVLAGDSAGAQIAAQLAAVTTNPGYADEMKITPALSPQHLKGLMLACGVYDASLADYSGSEGKFLNPVLWAYMGRKDFLNDAFFKTASVINYITKDFPPSLITAGNGDPLLQQSIKFNDKLVSLGVQTTPLFYEADHQPSLPHEYQFNLDSPDGQNALAQILAFLSSRTARR